MFRRFINEETVKQNGKFLFRIPWYKQETTVYNLVKNDSPEEQFCLIRWSDKTSFDIVSLKQIKAPASSITVYETYTVETNGRQRKGTVVLKGTFDLYKT